MGHPHIDIKVFEKAQRALESGVMNLREAAQSVGINPLTFSKWRVRHGYPPMPKGGRRPRTPRFAFGHLPLEEKQEALAKVRALLDQGVSLRAACKENEIPTNIYVYWAKRLDNPPKAPRHSEPRPTTPTNWLSEAARDHEAPRITQVVMPVDEDSQESDPAERVEFIFIKGPSQTVEAILNHIGKGSLNG